MFLASFTKDERKLIKKIAKFQLQSLKSILENDVEEDMTLYCLRNGLDEDGVRKAIKRNYRKFKQLRKDPNFLFNLDEDNLSIVKTVLNKYFGGQKGGPMLWHRFNVLDFHPTTNRLN